MFDFDDLEDFPPEETEEKVATDKGATGAGTVDGGHLEKAKGEANPPSSEVSWISIVDARARAAQEEEARKEKAPLQSAKKKVLWKVVKSIDPGGISVRNEKGIATSARLPKFSIIEELERKGSEIRYRLADGPFTGPRSGWVTVESRGNVWLERVTEDTEMDDKVATGKAEHQKAFIIVDWDDTLCPTTWIEELPELKAASDGLLKESSPNWTKLQDHAEVVKRFFQVASTLGTVVLVTLAERPWVLTSIKDFMPKAGVVNEYEVYYARESMGASKPPPGACALTAYKRRSMQVALEEQLKKLGKGTSWESLISIGDSDVERKAAQDLGREFQVKGTVKYTKTVKMTERPTLTQLTTQVRTLCEWLPEFANVTSHRNVTTTDLAKSSKRLTA
mmetsp:Transcript_57809/g.126828  ORF Transcript_57809/g.126828 Transcript_57809/m.126828 type:complete len:393 (-) Transcript_57809:122-1300(-)